MVVEPGAALGKARGIIVTVTATAAEMATTEVGGQRGVVAPKVATPRKGSRLQVCEFRVPSRSAPPPTHTHTHAHSPRLCARPARLPPEAPPCQYLAVCGVSCAPQTPAVAELDDEIEKYRARARAERERRD